MTELRAIYISGPMRKVGPPDFNHDQFCAVETVLRERYPHARIYNPALNFNGDKTLDYETYMTLDLQQVIMSDAITFLPYWEESEGSVEEARVGLATGKKFFRATGTGSFWQVNPLGVESVRAGVAGYGAPGLAESPRVTSLKRAINYISGDRNASYGPPTQDFERTADLWTAWGFRFVAHKNACTCGAAQPVKQHQIANAMILLKQSRLAWQPGKADSWDDTSGYAGCGYECAEAETSLNEAV